MSDELGRAIDRQRERALKLRTEVAQLEAALKERPSDALYALELKKKRAALSLAEDFGD